MLKRPKPGEDQEDLLQMQEEFLKERNKNPNLQPAAQVVNLGNEPSSKHSRTPSIYAQAKGLKKHTDKRVRFNDSTVCIGTVVEKNCESIHQHGIVNNDQNDDDKVYYPKVLPFVLGNIIEKNLEEPMDISQMSMPINGFPSVSQCDRSIGNEKKSIYMLNIEKQKKLGTDLKTSSLDTSYKVLSSSPRFVNLPDKSYILTSDEAGAIHKENVEVLSKMSEQEILQERNKLLNTLDPILIEFIKSKRKKTTDSQQGNELKQLDDSVNVKMTNNNEKMDVSEKSEQVFVDDTLWENDVLSHPNINDWLHFDTLEKDKLEWMKGIEKSKKINPNVPYEARFDLRGYLLPYTIEYSEKTKTLFHHGEEPHRPGYSFSELFELTRSTIPQQRVIALNTIAGILEYYMSGIYKDIVDIPLSKILFVVRFAMDENIVIILEPALKAMRNLLFNRIDEACLDLMVGLECVNQQPCLENDKSEISELDTQEAELKDFHLAEIDIITACLRTDIMQRLYYILDKIRPSFNCVQYSLQVLTRLIRDSTDTALRIVQTEHLMNTIIQYFVPNSSINFNFEPSMVYNRKPVLAALKNNFAKETVVIEVAVSDKNNLERVPILPTCVCHTEPQARCSTFTKFITPVAPRPSGANAYRIPPALVRTVASFLKDRDFYVSVEDATSDPRPIRAGVPQGSCLSPCLYAVYTDDIPTLTDQLQHWKEDVVLALYTDDSAYLASSRRADLAAAKLQRVLDLLPDWLDRWRVAVNVTKTAALLTGQQRAMPTKLRLRGQEVEWKTRVRYLGVQINRSMRMAAQVDHVIHQSRAAWSMLRPVLRSHLPLRAKVALYKGYIRSRLTYAAPAWYALCSSSQKKRIQAQQNITLRMIAGAGRYVLNDVIARDLCIETVEEFIQRIARRMFDNADQGPYEFLRNIAPMQERSPSGRTLPRELTRTPPPKPYARLGVAQRDRTPTHHDYHISRECDKPPATMPSRSRPTPTGTNAGRPACVCAAEHARRAPRYAPRTGLLFCDYPQLRSRIYTTAPKLTSPHFNSLKCRRLGTAAIPDVQSALVWPPPALTGR
ncbi:RNA polymerase II-associated protein 1 [Eumeta japonica]|uniref:RNA polymerase II-associated protein 1 n=1 Tax=Eumeta variegata TaxID=151549 RepID=A0A4C1UBP1_EUMVA|nr:RNA polymerase II-associated protein 1 [Eumeta japonica]